MILSSPRVKTFLLSGMIIVFLLSNAFAADRTWKQIGPAGGSVYEIIPDRSNPNIWYSIVNETLYRSSDNARSWKRIAEFVHSIALQSKEQSLYTLAGSNDSTLFKSLDYGETFTALGKSPPASRGLKLDQIVAGLIYSMNGHSLFRSSDDGRSWQELPVQFTADSNFFGCDPTKFDVIDVLPSPISPERVYASIEFFQCPIVNHKRVQASVLLESLNQGTSWQVVSENNNEGYSFEFDPAFPDHAFAFNGRQIQILTSSGWSSISKVPCPGVGCSAKQLVETVGRPGRFLLQQTFYLHGLYSARLLRSENGGKTWIVQASPFSTSLRTLRSMSLPFAGLVAGTEYGGLYRKIQNQKWQSANSGIESKIVLNRVLASGNKLYAYQEEYYGILLFRSDDRGEHWKDLFGTLPPAQIISLAISPHNGNDLMLVGTPSKNTTTFYISRDGGLHWKVSFSIIGRKLSSDVRILFDPLQPNVVFLNKGYGVYRNSEFGFRPNLVKVNGIIRMMDLAGDVTNPKIRYMTDGYKVFKSNDGGLSFQNTGSIPIEDDGDGAAYLCQVGTKSGTFLVDNDNMAVLMTTNSGQRWRYISQVPAGYRGGGDPPGAGKLIPADFEGMHFYTESHGGFFESNNGALSWRRLNHEWPVEKRLKDSIYSSDVAYSNGLLIVATNFGLFKAINSPP